MPNRTECIASVFNYDWCGNASQVDAYAREKKLQLVGYYQANEHLSDLELGPTGRRLADKLQQRCPEAFAVVVRGPLGRR
jgi:Uncharacterised protein family (UPF0172)